MKFFAHIICGRGSVSSDDNAIDYVLPVLWMPSRFHIMAQITDVIGELFIMTRQMSPGAKSALDDCLVTHRTIFVPIIMR